jgi:hypothetical protein
VESCPVGENTIVLAAPGFPAGKNEIFSTEYIIACCSRSKKLNIKDFRYYCSQYIYECGCCYRLKVVVIEINEIYVAF